MSVIYTLLTFIFSLFSLVYNHGLLFLYRPHDISNDCAFSQHLRYDLTFGMGMSDTITLVFRTLNEIDYKCVIEIVTDSETIFLLIVIRFPNNIATNCLYNNDAFAIIKKDKCLRLCNFLGERDVFSQYCMIKVQGRIRFRFASNSSNNADMNANMYQVTATSARMKPKDRHCSKGNETICVVGNDKFCFTSGVVCDGIKNCGVRDWYDERKSDCGLPVERLGFGPIVAVIAAILCAVLAAGHLLIQYLPPLANTFFIFNANEDNRLCINPILRPPEHSSSKLVDSKRASIIPVSSSSSSDIDLEGMIQNENVIKELQKLNMLGKSCDHSEMTRTTTGVKSLSAKIQEKLRSIAAHARRNNSSYSSAKPRQPFDI